MRQTIIITDLTQMPTGNEVCVAGIGENGECIRPICYRGFLKEYLYVDNKAVIRPMAKVEFDFHLVKVERPHVEDRGFDPEHIVSKGLCSSIEWENILRTSSYPSVEAIFDGLLEEHKWVRPGANTRSIGTLAKPTIIAVELSERSVKPRLKFRDTTGHVFDCPCSDLTLWDLCYSSVKRQGHKREQLSSELISSLRSAGRIYLRLGLARPFRITPIAEPRCYLQVTGIYTFPDYLQGKTFADF